ncbi:Ig domain-containing protein [Nocardioides marmoriginsengisoli]|nr:Ig domain-containing protein [Nocardioides marmoriginsengisoli]
MKSRLLGSVLTALLAGVVLAFPFGSPAVAAPAPLVITSSTLPTAPVLAPYTATLKATGGNFGRVWSLVSGTLPSGLKLSAQGRITGTPTQEGPAVFTVGVHDTANPRQSATAVIDLAVGPMQITTTTIPSTIYQGKTYPVTQLKVAGGKKPYTWSIVQGSLPFFKTITQDGKIGGAVALFPGTRTFTVQVADSTGRTAVRQYQIEVRTMEITTATLPQAKRNAYYSAPVKVAGGIGKVTWTIDEGALPPGLKLSASGVISGVPKQSGSWTFTVMASHDFFDAGGTDRHTYTLVVS